MKDLVYLLGNALLCPCFFRIEESSLLLRRIINNINVIL